MLFLVFRRSLPQVLLLFYSHAPNFGPSGLGMNKLLKVCTVVKAPTMVPKTMSVQSIIRALGVRAQAFKWSMGG